MLFGSILVCHFTGNPCPLQGHFPCIIFKQIIGLRDALGGERVGSDDVSAGLNVLAKYVFHHIRPGYIEHVIVSLHHPRLPSEQLSPKIFFCQMIVLDHRSHRSVKDKDSLFNQLLNCFHRSLFNHSPLDIAFIQTAEGPSASSHQNKRRSVKNVL